MPPAADENWLYHLPAFLERVRDRGAHRVSEEIDLDLGGVLYHHRGARIPAFDATFALGEHGDRFELALDAVGPRSARAVFDAERSWDVYLVRIEGDQPCLVWMTDAEFRADEAGAFASKEAAVAAGRFSFGLYLHAPRTWADLAARARETDAPLFVHRPSGQTFVPAERDLAAFAEVLPEELRPDDATPPDYLGVVDAEVDAG